VSFKTRPQQVIEMIEAARGAGVAFGWFTADEEFGQNPGLRHHLETAGIAYVMAVPKTTLFADASGRTVELDQRARRLRRNAWQRRACGIGTKAFRVYDWTLLESDDPDHQYMIRRSIDDGELAFYHCHNPNHAGFGELVTVAGARWPIEECFGSGKNEVGLDNYQVRTYDAWHRHTTLAMLTHTFLAITAHKAKKRGPKNPSPSTSVTTHPTLGPNPKRRHLSTGASSTSPSPKSADSSTSPTAANTPSPTDCTGQPGVADTKPTLAGLTSDATYDYRRS
jgi:SRSO17 transposase